MQQSRFISRKNDLEYVRTCIDDLLIISDKSIENYTNKLDKIVSKLKAKDFKEKDLG